MKKIIIPAFLALLILTGCVGGRVMPMGNDTYAVEHRGEIYSTELSLEAKCLRDANKYCAKHHLQMTVLQTNGHDPIPFDRMGACQLIFKGVPTNNAVQK